MPFFHVFFCELEAWMNAEMCWLVLKNTRIHSSCSTCINCYKWDLDQYKLYFFLKKEICCVIHSAWWACSIWSVTLNVQLCITEAHNMSGMLICVQYINLSCPSLRPETRKRFLLRSCCQFFRKQPSLWTFCNINRELNPSEAQLSLKSHSGSISVWCGCCVGI